VQRPSGDFFEYLALDRKLQIDLPELEQQFYSLSRRLHPDIYFHRSRQEREIAENAAAWLNDAYRTLKDPVKRAEHLLDVLGIPRKRRDPREPRAGNTPPELVEEIFEIQMLLDDVRQGDKSAASGLAHAKAKFETLLQETDASLNACFAEWDRVRRPEKLREIATILDRRSYIEKALQNIMAALADD
jgi:molecular chaperone HscB